MTTTPVKDVNAAFMNLTGAQNGKNAGENGDFLKVWSNQMSKGAQGNMAWDNLPQGSPAKPVNPTANQKTEVSKADNSQKQDAVTGEQETAKSIDNTEVSDKAVVEESEELSPEELEEAMEVLGTAAMELMQQIADVFGISMEELQTAMEELGMDMTDVLDVSQLSQLLLNLGGAENSYALITDESLYGKYQELMGQLDETLQESAETLGMDPEELVTLLKKAPGKEEVISGTAETLPVETEVEVSGLTEGTIKAEESMEPVQNVERRPDGQESQANAQDGQEESQTNTQDNSQNQTGQVNREVRQESNDKVDREQPVGMFAQHLEANEFSPQVQQADNIPQSNGWSADTQDIMNQIMDYMKLQLNADSTSLEMQLHPASLGTLQIQLASKAGVVTANFIAQNEAVKTALENQISQLKESFEEQGVKVEAIEVTVQTHEFERNLEQGRGRNQQGSETEKKSRLRRINLDNPAGLGDLDEEDALAADRLAASGSTVEFTA